MRSKSPAQASGDVRALIVRKGNTLVKRYQDSMATAVFWKVMKAYIQKQAERAKKAPGGVQRQKKGAK